MALVFSSSVFLDTTLLAAEVTKSAVKKTIKTEVKENTKVIVGSSPVMSSAGIYLALEKGFFKDAGLDVEVTNFNNSGAAMTLLLSKGEMDVGAGNLSSGLFNAIANGEKVKLVADKGHVEKNKEYISLLVRKDHITSGRYKTTKDLKGMKVSFTSLDGVSQQVVFDQILKNAGLTEKDVEYIKLSYAESNTALKTKALDAAIQLEPFKTKAVLEDFAVSVLSSQEIIPDQQSACILYSEKFISKPEAALKFMESYLKGVRMYNDALGDKTKWAEVVTLLKKHIKIDDDKVWESMAPVGLYNDGHVDAKSLYKDLAWYKEKGYVVKVPSEKELIDGSFAEKANKNLNKTLSKKNNKK